MDEHKVDTLKKLRQRRGIFEDYITLVKKQVSSRKERDSNKDK